jgi:hypothetical protein
VLREASRPNIDSSATGLTQLEQLFEQFVTNALNGHHQPAGTAPIEEQIEQVHIWTTRLFHDHKWRLTQNLPQVALPGIQAVIAEALSQSYSPMDLDFEELIIDIESRKQY